MGELEPAGLPAKPRYLVTYMNSQTGGPIRSATVVSITNQSRVINRVFVSFFRGFQDNTTPVGVAAFAIPPDFTVDFASRNLPGEITVVNAIPTPELVFDEGRAIVSSIYPEIGVSARVIYHSARVPWQSSGSPNPNYPSPKPTYGPEISAMMRKP